MPRLPNTRTAAYIFLLINAALWGISPPIIKNTFNYVSPTIFLLYRYLIAAVIFTPIFLKHKTDTNRKTSPWLFLSLALLSTPLTLYPLFEGLKLTTSIEGSLIESTSPLFTILGGLIFLREIIKPKEWMGLGFAILGTLILTAEPLISGNHATITSFSGNLLILASNLIWASFLLLSKKNKVDSIKLTYFSFLISIPFFLVLALFEKQSLSLDTRALPGILYMVIFGSIIAFWAYQEGQKRIEASEAAVFSYLKPLFTLPLAIFWLMEPVKPLVILGGLVILVGVYISEKR